MVDSQPMFVRIDEYKEAISLIANIKGKIKDAN
jgi:hypothetical protein